MEIDEIATLLALKEISGIGDKRALELYRAFGTVDELQSRTLNDFGEFHYVDAETHSELQELSTIVNECQQRLAQYQAEGITIIGIDDDRYPTPLRSHHAPLVLYAKGDVKRLSEPSISVSGARETNDAGQKWVRGLGHDLAEDGYTIVSGGAQGADTAAHRGALSANGKTIVVLGTGVNIPYPKENAEFFSEIVRAGGLLLSHRPPNAEPNRHAFLDRNETISALSPGVIIVATDGSGGTQAQYEIAKGQQRTVFLPPDGEGIEPAAGLSSLRSDTVTTTVSSAGEIKTEIESTELHESENLRSSASSDRQTKIGDWD